MSVDREEVDRIAGLAKLRLERQEAARLVREMTRILDYVERLQAEPTTQGTDRAPADEAPTAETVDAPTPVVGDARTAGPGDAPTRGAADAGTPADDTTGGLDARITGTRDAEAEAPDPLRRGPADFAPRIEDGFFVVPPPPGVVAEGVERATGDEP